VLTMAAAGYAAIASSVGSSASVSIGRRTLPDGVESDANVTEVVRPAAILVGDSIHPQLRQPEASEWTSTRKREVRSGGD
jgi:hypothetical protein